MGGGGGTDGKSREGGQKGSQQPCECTSDPCKGREFTKVLPEDLSC